MSKKTVQEFCANCNKTHTMSVVQQSERNPDLVWVECPSCHEIKPLDLTPPSTKDEKSRPEDQAENHGGKQDALDYPGAGVYEVGDTVYHRAWDDTGKVIEKRTSSGGHPMIIVEFNKSGKKKLLL